MDANSPNSRGTDDCRREYEDYRNRFDNEHNLIDRKITWLLTSQALLFAALGFSLRGPSLALVRIMAGVGLAICLGISVGLIGNIGAKWCVFSDYRQFVEGRPDCKWGVRPGTNTVEFGVRTLTTWLGIIADIVVPLTFALAWLLVLVLSSNIVEAAETGSTAP
jgi:hypothetical protein